MYYSILVIVLFYFSLARGAEICCDAIGCFSDDSPFDHLPLPDCPDDIPTTYHLYTRNNRESPEIFDRHTIPTQNFEPSRLTIFVVHGYMNSPDTDWLIDIKNALLDVADYNVISIGWEGILLYPSAASTVRTVGAEAGLVANNLAGYGASYSNMWCVGYSLGAHLCAHLGMNTDQKITRVTGMDPAGPEFENADPSTGINPSVANFVDILHTNAHNGLLGYGMLRAAGHMDFYPNGGDNLQPGCSTYYNEADLQTLDLIPEITHQSSENSINLSCSHGRAHQYFLESITSDCFIARQTCTDPDNMPGSCSDCNGGNECARMGYNAEGSGAFDIYYLQTNSDEPYCLN